MKNAHQGVNNDGRKREKKKKIKDNFILGLFSLKHIISVKNFLRGENYIES